VGNAWLYSTFRLLKAHSPPVVVIYPSLRDMSVDHLSESHSEPCTSSFSIGITILSSGPLGKGLWENVVSFEISLKYPPTWTPNPETVCSKQEEANEAAISILRSCAERRPDIFLH